MYEKSSGLLQGIGLWLDFPSLGSQEPDGLRVSRLVMWIASRIHIKDEAN